MAINVNLDISQLGDLKALPTAAKRAITEAGNKLVAATHAHMVEEAGKKLHTRREMYVENLFQHPVDNDTWVISLDGSVRWIEDGIQAHNMLEDLLASPKAKTSKTGSKYLVVPFEHGPKGPTQMTQAQSTLLGTIKEELKRRKIPYNKIEKDEHGNAKLGKLHSFDIMDAPLKTANVPGQGKGPIGAVMQGPGAFSHGGMQFRGTPLLKGVSIYQKQVGNSVKRGIMTFRIASSTQAGQGKWDHPGLEPVNIFDEAADWARNEWEKNVGPELIDQIMKMT